MKLQNRFTLLMKEDRLYHLEKPLIALTGGIATGKSTVSKLLSEKGVHIIDADRLVKNIYQKEESKAFIRDNWPQVIKEDDINFKVLREIVFKDSEVKAKVEAFIYARLPEAFREESRKITNQDFYFYDVPLLFERQLDRAVDLKILVYAPRKIQLARIIDRDGSTEEVALKILDQQMDIEEKKSKVDFVIDNSVTLVELQSEVDRLVSQLFY